MVMHRGHDHDHESGGSPSQPAIAGVGHNHVNMPVRPAQWQVLHGDPKPGGSAPSDAVTDLDLVEAAFVEGFLAASDPTSFLRLARVPFRATALDGAELSLLRVEVDSIADVGTITPHLGGDTFRYDPLPARMVSRRRRLRFVYFDGTRLRPLGLAEVMASAPD
jgi:hypothetical protein